MLTRPIPGRAVASVCSPVRLVAASLLAVLLTSSTTPAQINCDYEPQNQQVVLNTDRTQIQAKNCMPMTVIGGVFVFRNVKIPAGVTVRGVGSRPMIWIVTGDFIVEGELNVNGIDGQSVSTLNSANFPTPGGAAVCTSGSGGFGSPNTTNTSLAGQTAFGPYNIPNFGGGGGIISCLINSRAGSGGGGGTLIAPGDPKYPFSAPQRLGQGGSLSATMPGGRPGQTVFVDNSQDNDFWGVGIDVARLRIVVGEMPLPFGGGGGGGGGDQSTLCTNNPNWINDRKGAGGASGGGVLIIFAQNKIVVGASGRITANGGNGGGGEMAGSNGFGGGGGGGAGGMLVLATFGSIQLQAHGETYARQDYDFSLSADGGIGVQSNFGTQPFLTKYPPKPIPQNSGGFGGMGLVQLMVPPGASNADSTNTRLDDNIHVLRGTQPLVGKEKIRYLAWRGFQNTKGVFVDDNGVPTNIGSNEGDIRPSPVILPMF